MERTEMQKVSNSMKGRGLFLLIVFMFAILGIIAVMGYIDFSRGTSYLRMAMKFQTTDKMIPAERGSIIDRNGKTLAMSTTVYTIAVDPVYIKQNRQEEKIVKLFHEVLKLDNQSIKKKLLQNTQYQVIQKQVSQENIDKIRSSIKKQKIMGIILQPETKRFYPYNQLASHLIGFVKDDAVSQVGLAGLELEYDRYLAGVPGRILAFTDQLKKQLIETDEGNAVEPKPGLNLTTTIDVFIQSTAEQVLKKTVEEHKAKRGTVIVMQPHTGEIYAMASYPEFNNNLQSSWRNFAIHETYEPGSTFKVLTVAGALEDGTSKMTDQFFDKGYAVVEGTRINSWKAGGFGMQTLTQVLENSSNVGLIDIVAKLGAKRFNYYTHTFGLDFPTGIDLPGEAKGVLHSGDELHPVELATSAFGQTFQVTPLQMVTALSSTVNGGNLIRPYIVKEIRDQEGNIVEKKEPHIYRQVISEKTSEEIREMMRAVVKNATGKKADISGYRIGGKTGTSEKLPRNSGLRIASFVGIAPSEDPKAILLMVIDEPGGPEKGGGAVAAPAVKEIFSKILPYLGVEPLLDQLEEKTVTLRDYTHLDLQTATVQLVQNNLQYIIQGVGNYVVDQYPKPGSIITENKQVILVLGENPQASKKNNSIEQDQSQVKEQKEEIVDSLQTKVIQGMEQ